MKKVKESNIRKLGDRMYINDKIESQMKAGIIGFAVGDALGVPVEFINRNILNKHPIKDMMGFGSHNVPEGTWSDDTSLTIAAMDSIAEKNNIDYEDIMNNFENWLDKAEYTATDKVFDIGISTSKAIHNHKYGKNAIECGTKGFNENGNGSLMRILPFTYYIYANNFQEKEKVDIINSASSLTHAHEISKLGCKIYSDYVTYLLDGKDKYEALNLVRNTNYEEFYSKDTVNIYNRILNQNLESIREQDIKSSGFVVHSLEASLWCTLNNNSYEEAVINAVNLGEDTDTIGAITGSINGILYGENNIPDKWLNKLKKREYLENLTDKFIDSLNYEKNRRL